jgi:hypothetical protein
LCGVSRNRLGGASSSGYPNTQDELRQARRALDVEIDLGRLEGENCRLQR